MELKEKLTQLRKEKGLSQLELAEIMDVSRQAVSRWETGLSIPSVDKLKRLSDLYGVSLDSLWADARKPGGEIDKQQEESIPVTPEDEESVQAPSKRRCVTLRIIIVICVAALITIIAFSMLQKRHEDHYILMNEIEPTEAFSESSENFSLNW